MNSFRYRVGVELVEFSETQILGSPPEPTRVELNSLRGAKPGVAVVKLLSTAPTRS